jgi:hypothetical protein
MMAKETTETKKRVTIFWITLRPMKASIGSIFLGLWFPWMSRSAWRELQ